MSRLARDCLGPCIELSKKDGLARETGLEPANLWPHARRRSGGAAFSAGLALRA